MARKGRKTRWRKLPIPIGNNQGEASCAAHNVPNNLESDHSHQHPSSPPPKEQVSRVTFNEDEYTKITTPRQDMLFKKGYLSKKRPQQPQESQQTSYTSPEPSNSPSDSVESEQYVGCEDAGPFPLPFMYPTGYMDPNGLFYLNSGSSYEVYDPYTNSVTVIVGPGNGYPGQPMLTAVPCHPVPLQPIEWFAPPPQNHPPSFKKRNSTDSQNWGSSQSCESPSSGLDLETPDSGFYPQPQYIYPGYMFGAPLYNINGVSVQGAGPPPHSHAPHQPHLSTQQPPTPPSQPQPADQPKRRKKRRKRRRPGMGDEGSESSCEEVGGSGVSSDAGQGSSCSKTTDSGIHTGADSPQPQSSPLPGQVSPPPEVSTEEEPSQPSVGVSHVQQDHDHSPTDTSTEDEAQRLLEHVPSSPSHPPPAQQQLLPPKETDVPPVVPTIKDDDTTVLTQTEVRIEAQIKREESEEWVNAKQDNEEESSIGTSDNNEETNRSPVNTEPLLNGVDIEEEIIISSEHELSPEIDNAYFFDRIVLNEEADPLPKENSTEDTPSLKNSPVILIDESYRKERPEKEEGEECVAEEMGYSEEGWGSAEETSVEERWALAEEAVPDKPITEAVTRWLEAQGTKALASPPAADSEDEGIGEETSRPTGSKNVRGNPFLVRYPSTGNRVADMTTYECETGLAWRAMCDPVASVDRYYRLGADLPPSPPFKTATAHTLLHMDPSLPFPCGLICCVLQ